jgi:hypothetical protein
LSRRFICEGVDAEGNPVKGTGCGELDHILFDGYSFGDRLLEGVTFKAFLQDGQIAVDTVDKWDTDPYLVKLNQAEIMDEALRFAQQNDIAECPICHGQIDAQPQDNEDA